jgi:hypothetical protein
VKLIARTNGTAAKLPTLKLMHDQHVEQMSPLYEAEVIKSLILLWFMPTQPEMEEEVSPPPAARYPGSRLFLAPASWCRLATTPRSRPEYWLPKLARNVERDLEVRTALAQMGWRSEIVWEC